MTNRSVLHMLLWFFGFSEGLFNLFNIPTNISRFFVSLIIIRLLFSKKIPQPLFILSSIFLAISIISVVANEYFEMVPFFLFIFMALQGIFYFIVLINEDHNTMKKIVSYANFFILIQIPSVLIKFMIIGISEGGGIGTMSRSAGSLSAIFPCVVITLIVSQYLHKKNIKWAFWLVVFVLFGIIGNKRVLIFLVPAIIWLVYLCNLAKFSEVLKFESIIILLVTILIIYGCIWIIPTLNPENKSFGKLDTEYTKKYIGDYVTTDKNEYRRLELRRMAGLVYFLSYLKNKDTLTFFFGEGTGKLVQTAFRKQSASMPEVYGVRYGGRMGIIWIYLQLGLLGTIVWLLFFLYIFYKIYKSRRRDIYTNAAIVIFFVIMFDVFIYSCVTIRFFPVFSLWGLISSLSYRRNVLGYNEIYNKKSHYLFTSSSIPKSESFEKGPLLPITWVRLKF
jgi:hypothetical protein